MEKVPVERNTVQETLVIPLYARVLCTKAYPTCSGMKKRQN